MAERSLGKGVAIGAVSGLAASWLMLQFIEGPGKRWLAAGKTEQDQEQERLRQERDGPDTPESVAMQAADTFASHAPGGRHLTLDERRKGGTLVHYGFGALMGAFYGGTTEVAPVLGAGVGVPFGTLLWGGDGSGVDSCGWLRQVADGRAGGGACDALGLAHRLRADDGDVAALRTAALVNG